MTLAGFVGAHGAESGVLSAEPGLARMGARYYDTGSGRWLQQDPIGSAGGTNWYAYANNAPAADIDPLGLSSQDGQSNGTSDTPPPNLPCSDCGFPNPNSYDPWVIIEHEKQHMKAVAWRMIQEQMRTFEVTGGATIGPSNGPAGGGEGGHPPEEPHPYEPDPFIYEIIINGWMYLQFTEIKNPEIGFIEMPVGF